MKMRWSNHLMYLALACSFFACGALRVVPESTASLQASVISPASTFDRYQLEGAAWVANQPLLLSRDFDFSMAMVDELGAAGVAAARRLSDNRTAAENLSAMPGMDLASVLLKSVGDCGASCRHLDRQEVRLFGLLFGEVDVRLQSVLEARRADQAQVRLVVVSGEKRALSATDGSWIAADGRAIAHAMQQSIPKLLELYTADAQHRHRYNGLKREAAVDCPVQAKYAVKGFPVTQLHGQPILLAADMPETLILCEQEVHNH